MYDTFVGQCDNCLEREVSVYATGDNVLCIHCLDNEENANDD